MNNLLKFSKHNSKLHKVAEELNLGKRDIVGFDLPAGWTCPSAMDCKSKASRYTGKITDGKDCKFRCYAVSAESAFTNARRMRWYNLDLLRAARTEYQMTRLILASLPDTKMVRIHTSGDFFNKKYFDAWIRVAFIKKKILFYGYTKQAHYLENSTLLPDNVLPDNFRFVVSHGGKNSHKALNHRRAYVLFGKNACIPVYTDIKSELHILENWKGSFGLLVHGTQPAGFYKNKKRFIH